MRFFVLLFTIIFIAGCQRSHVNKDSETLFLERSFKQVSLDTGSFSLMAWIPPSPKEKKLRVYIEGDGRAWMRRGRASSDPTPVNRLVHRLMQVDPKHDIAYIARPCQYTLTANCKPYFWTFGRYDENIVTAMNSALDQLKHKGSYQTLELVGYSGGATIALLLAARRDDILNVRTIAGNLDPAFTNTFHIVSPMPSALNPANFTNALTTVPQVHFFGEKDRIIPEQISAHYQQQFVRKDCLSRVAVPEANHAKGWQKRWQAYLLQEPECRTKKSP